MIMGIQKTIITITILHDSDLDVHNMSIESLMREIDQGDAIGLVLNHGTNDVHKDAVKSELKALGNDGKFFDESE